MKLINLLKKTAAKMPDNIQTDLKQIYFRQQIKQGKFVAAEPEFNILDQFIDQGDWVMDVGANIGHYTLRFSGLVGENGRVIAFEPISSTFTILSANVLRSEYHNITLMNIAASDKTCSAGMDIPKFSTGLKNYYQANILPRENSVDTQTKILTIAIDSLNIEHKIKLVKIDAEGHEPFVFEGMQELLERDKPIIITETVTSGIRNRLVELGYSEKKYNNSPNTLFSTENL